MNFSQKTKPFQGVFSTTRKSVIGTGDHPSDVSARPCIFFVEQDEKGHIVMRPLNQNMVPVGTAVSISKDELLADYTPEPSVYLHKVHPQMRKMEDHAQRGEKLREEGALYTAEFEYKCALALAEDHVRSVFGLGLIYLERGDLGGADMVFNKIITLEAAFGPENKHLFNDFGIRLRKSRMLDQAVLYYRRAIELCDDDENLYYNISRAYFEQGEFANAMAHGEKALKMNPEFAECRNWCVWRKNPPFAAGCPCRGPRLPVPSLFLPSASCHGARFLQHKAHGRQHLWKTLSPDNVRRIPRSRSGRHCRRLPFWNFSGRILHPAGPGQTQARFRPGQHRTQGTGHGATAFRRVRRQNHGHAHCLPHRQYGPAVPRLFGHQGCLPARTCRLHLRRQVRFPRLPGRRPVLGPGNRKPRGRGGDSPATSGYLRYFGHGLHRGAWRHFRPACGPLRCGGPALLQPRPRSYRPVGRAHPGRQGPGRHPRRHRPGAGGQPARRDSESPCSTSSTPGWPTP